ncbi:hypothetical protein VTJ83DRAFT_3626 [Remersonia thermophila]|uniref:P-loop containing nucleoside triphosphate hydrolase protein n=1 Tax=Remersonia thermophila TaxID=72144 RepID=A0ABR4DEP9_9PEZI
MASSKTPGDMLPISPTKHASSVQGGSIPCLKSPQTPTTDATMSTVPVKVKSNISHLFAFTPPAHAPLLAVSFATSAVLAAARTAYAVLLGRLFECAADFGSGVLAPAPFLAEVSKWAVWLCVLGVGIWAFATVDVASWIVGGELKAKTAREQVFESLLRRNMAWQTRELQAATSQTLGFLVRDAFLFLGCAAVALSHSYKLTLAMLATAVPSALVLWAIGRFLDPAIEAQKRELAQAAKQVNAAVTAIDIVKVYNAADHEAFQFVSTIRRSARFYFRQTLCNCGQMSYVKFWMVMLFVIGFYLAVVLVNRGELTAGQALTTFYAVLIAFQSVETFGPQWLVLAKGMAAGQALSTLVKQNDDQVETSGWLMPSMCRGDVRMSNVSFAYPSNPEKRVLQPSSFHFEAGRLTFVVGSSGCGKSTLGNLLVRFHEPLTGRIILDNNSISTLDLAWLRRNVTLIQQSSTLFNDTLFQNVAFGANDPAAVTADEVRSACAMALLQSTIADMPDGINTTLGPGGYSLSGGQKQRLALARAKLRDPPVLILDEITSGLDPVSKSLIMDAIRLWRQDKTTIIITHDIGHIKNDEYVYVMADGSILQHGFRRDVSLDKGGLFASLAASAGSESSSSVSSDGESEHYIDWPDEEPIREARLVKLLRGTIVDGRPMSVGLFSNFSLRATAAFEKTFADQQQHHRAIGPKSTRSTKKFAEAAVSLLPMGRLSTEIVTQQGLRVQESRTPNARAALQKELDAERQASLESLEAFFLERLAKPKDRKQPPKNGRPAPSLRAIFKTVWPTLERMGRVELVLGVLLCFVAAVSTPVFSFFFANLIAGFWTGDGSKTGLWTGALAAIAVVDAAATFFAYLFMERVAQRWVDTLRAEAFRRILCQPKTWFDKDSHSPNRITQCFDRNGEEMRKLVGTFAPIMLTVTAMVATSLIWAIAIRFDLALVTLSGLPVAVVAARANSLASDKWEARCDAAAATANAILNETFSQIRIVRALTLERFFSDRHQSSSSAAYKLGLRRGAWVGATYGLHQSLGYFLTALVFYYASRLLSDGRTTVTDAIKVINLLLFSIGTSVAMLANLPQIAAAKTTAVQMLYYANLSPTSSHESRGHLRLLGSASLLQIRMNALRFAYPSTPNSPILRNITLQFNAGTCTAVVGASGCGKSTLASILLRLYEPLPTGPDDDASAGPSRISTAQAYPLTYAGHPASLLHTPSLRTHLAYVPQQPFLFPATVRENLAYGLPDASPLREHANLARAARQAGIEPLIDSLPQGYDTVLGEGGLGVSGGQAQRLCIARALARRPRLLVMDEPTSALDAEAAADVRRVVAQLVSAAAREGEQEGGMAVVVVTHSKEMMKMADRVVMLEDGVVVGSGRYEDLIEKEGRFADLVGGGETVAGGRNGKRQRERARREALKRLEGEM